VGLISYSSSWDPELGDRQSVITVYVVIINIPPGQVNRVQDGKILFKLGFSSGGGMNGLSRRGWRGLYQLGGRSRGRVV
jgi:hypothetical protein